MDPRVFQSDCRTHRKTIEATDARTLFNRAGREVDALRLAHLLAQFAVFARLFVDDYAEQ
jgi:hypothetical protein